MRRISKWLVGLLVLTLVAAACSSDATEDGADDLTLDPVIDGPLPDGARAIDSDDVPAEDFAADADAAGPAADVAETSDGFFEDFSDPDSFARFEYGLFHRDDHLVVQEEWFGDHVVTGPDDECSLPEERRRIRRGDRDEGFNDDWIYRCAPMGDPELAHLMTSIGDTSGYSIGAFTPAMSFVDVVEVRWSVNQTDLGDRQFTEIAIIPTENFHFMRLPCQIGLPCGTDPGNVLGLNDDDTINHHEIGSIGTQWGGQRARVINTIEQPTGYVQAFGEPGYRCDGCDYSPGMRFGEAYGADDPALTSVRPRLENYLRDNGDGTVTWGLVLSDGTVNDFTVPGAFPSGPVRVVFKDHGYTPLKSEATLVPETTFTWHWDDIEIITEASVA